MKSSEIMKNAKECIGEKKLTLFISVFLFSVLSSISENLWFVALIFFIISPALNYGITSIFIKRRNGEDVGPFDFITEGFANFGRAWKVTLRLFLKFLVPILLIVFVILGTFVFSFGESFATDGSTLIAPQIGYTQATVAAIAASVMAMVAWVLTIVSIIIMIPFIYKYRYAYNEAIMSPELSAKEVVNRTAEVMKGNRWKSFCLDFLYFLVAFAVAFLSSLIGSFLTDILETFLTLAILSYFVKVSYNMSHVIFYDDKRNQNFGDNNFSSSIINEYNPNELTNNIENNYSEDDDTSPLI